MSFVLAAIVITIFATIFIPPYLNPIHNVYQDSASMSFPSGFTVLLQLNSSTFSSGSGISLVGTLNSTFTSIENVTSEDLWAIPQDHLSENGCFPGWPLGVGIMRGHYTSDNITLGTVVAFQGVGCISNPSVLPSYYLFEPHSTKMLVPLNGSVSAETAESTLTISAAASSQTLKPGEYTAVVVDEWGDVLTSLFLVT
jgi:hypothetical protein